MKTILWRQYLIVILLACSACRTKPDLREYKSTRFAMGTVIEITVLDTSETRALQAIDDAFTEIQRIAGLFYEGNPSSPVYQFNHRTQPACELPPEVLGLVQRGIDLSRLTCGAFDMTVGVLLPLYDFKARNPQPPADSAIARRLPHVGYTKLTIDPNRHILASSDPRTMLAVGAIAKGYGVDQAIAVLERQGVAGAIVNAGGDLRVIPRIDGQPWRIGIQHPRRSGEILRVLAIRNGAVTTSGDYEKYFIHDGRRIHHLIDPQTGRPAANCQAVTVIAPTAEMADALATGLFVLGAEKGPDILNQVEGCAALWVNPDGQTVMSPGFEAYTIKSAGR